MLPGRPVAAMNRVRLGGLHVVDDGVQLLGHARELGDGRGGLVHGRGGLVGHEVDLLGGAGDLLEAADCSRRRWAMLRTMSAVETETLTISPREEPACRPVPRSR